ncbi:MAG: DNA-binding protein [Methylacidiphilales bacterium]|nr:DNA-binding protein [Candidatus Methylacidiphilales bacterium]
MVGTSQAASLLDVCEQRVRQLLKEGRVVGAEKVDGFWRIPLFNGMPKVREGTRGPKSTWRKRARAILTRIHIIKANLDRNRREKGFEAVIAVRKGSKVKYYHEVEIGKFGKLVYRPENPLTGVGAVLWLEINPDVNVVGKNFVYQ